MRVLLLLLTICSAACALHRPAYSCPEEYGEMNIPPGCGPGCERIQTKDCP
jgi:hypothetical protein